MEKKDWMNLAGVAIKVVGITLCVVLGGLLIWSLFRPPVESPFPVPEPPSHSVTPKKGCASPFNPKCYSN